MGIVYLVLFILAEAALVVLTFTKFSNKPQWRKNRLFVRAAEAAVLLGIILVPVTYLKWRFFMAFSVLIIRLIIAGVAFLVKRGKADGVRSKGASIASCVLSVILIAVALMPSFIFANYNGLKTTGEYEVAKAEAILVDESRPDTFENDGSFREVPVYFFYPEACESSCPLVVFSHGAFGYYQSNFSTYMELASHGYVVAALDHPHHSFFTKDTDGKLITVDSDFIEGAVKIGGGEEVTNEEVFEISKDWMDLRTGDMSFALDSIIESKTSGVSADVWHTDDTEKIQNVISITDTGKIGCMGHSLGGAASVALGRERGDIDAVIDLDGTALGEVTGIKNGECVCIDEPYPVPILLLSQVAIDEASAYSGVTVNLVSNAITGKHAEFENAGHSNFTDLPLFSPFLGKMLGTGEVDSEECVKTVNSLVLNWFDYYLKGEGAPNIQARY